MKLLCYYSLCFYLYLVQTILADLKSDTKALVDFATAVPHARRLNWNNRSSVCSSWTGVSCTPNGARVVALRLPGFGLRGPIPHNTLGRLDALVTLSLRANFLEGSLPSDVFSIPSLRYINFQHNNFSGDIPYNISSSTQLNGIDLSFNLLTGFIPIAIQNLTHLTGLFLQNNSFSGPIPDFNLPNLKQLNISNNKLNGSIPSHLQTFPASSFAGNSMLCGRPLIQNCSAISSLSPSPSPPQPSSRSPPSPIHSPSSVTNSNEQKIKKSLSTGAKVAIGVGGATVLIGLSLVALVFCLKKKQPEHVGSGRVLKGKREVPKEEFGSGVQESKNINRLTFFEGCSYNFNLEDLLRASAEVLGKGSYGTTYTAILEEGGTLVVKRLREIFGTKREFEQLLKAIGSMSQHHNVVSLRAYYYSKDEKLLVYDHVPGGSLSTLLHGNRESGVSLDWESRVKISLGAAKGVAHIHSTTGAKLTHGNIKSSNVLVTLDSSARITDYGLTPFMGLPTIPSKSAGYRAPETIQTRKSTEKSDVYSFGVLLLELLTGKSPIQSPGSSEVVDLPQWVQSVVREEWTAEVFDTNLIRYQNKEEEMVQMLQIAMACVTKAPEMRPSMDEVVRIIEEIKQPNSENRSSSEKSKSTQSLTL